jgi:predicted amidohydrolase
MNGLLGPTVDANMQTAMELLELAGSLKPDIVCLPEAFATAGTPGGPHDKAQELSGPAIEACASVARKLSSYIICPVLTTREGRVYNSAVIIDRAGGIAGVYEKVHPVTSRWDFSEVESGVTPGSEAGVFELDCGRIGVQICFDIGFPETWQDLADGGAELVFWPSAYDGGFPLRAYAYLHSYYVVSSVRTVRSRIIDPLGEVLECTGRRMQVASQRIDLDYMVCHSDFHWQMAAEMTRTHGADVYTRTLDEEGRFLVASDRDDLELSALAQEWGLGSNRDYHDRHRRAYTSLRQGKEAEPQIPPYAGREPYTRMGLEEWREKRES